MVKSIGFELLPFELDLHSRGILVNSFRFPRIILFKAFTLPAACGSVFIRENIK